MDSSKVILKKALDANDPVVWNEWRKGKKMVNFTKINFSQLNAKVLNRYNFTGVEFRNCEFSKNLIFSNCLFDRGVFTNCIFSKGSSFPKTDFRSAVFVKSKFYHVNFMESVFRNATFEECTLKGLDLKYASLVECTFQKTKIVDCEIYGANIWDIDTDELTQQKDLKIPFKKKSGFEKNEMISIDDLQLANVIYLLLDNSNYKRWIDESKSKSVLILGRFGKNLKTTIDALKTKLRSLNLSPIVFDFDSPTALDLIEAIILLSFLSKFIIVDLSRAKSVPAELQAILSTLMIPVVPIMQSKSRIYSTFSFTNKFKWVLPVLVFEEISDVIDVFKEAILKPANALYDEIKDIKAHGPMFKYAKEFTRKTKL